uniref:patatin-like phospholipase family protein n=1 Tax=Thiocapsa sp. TaxID=2024551 RepID=UPI0025F89493
MTPLAQPAGYVDPIDLEDLALTAHNEASAEQRLRAPFPVALEQAETDYVHAWRRQRGCDEPEVTSDKRVGLALSGGGIRSATFALGAMQALAARGLLEKFDYLSTVSGGGYIGGALTWLLSKDAQGDGVPRPDAARFGLDPSNFPFGTDDPRPDAARRADERQRRMLGYLREHGYYLTPGAGITAVSLLGIVLRGTFLNLIVWIPIYVLFFLFGLWFFGHYNPGVDGMFLLPMLMDIRGHAELFGFELFLWIGVLLLGLTVLGTLIYALLTGVRRENTMPGIARVWYVSRRLVERLGGVLLTAIVLFFLIGSLPAIGDHLKESFKSVGPIAMLSGMGVSMRRFLTPQPDAVHRGPDLMANLGAALFLFGTLLVTYEIAFWLSFQELITLAVTVLIAVALVFGWLVNCNYISIHRFYRDRLMETFMPDIDRALNSETGAALGADVARLTDVADSRSPRGPYHIINTNVVLADSRECVYRNRGGDSFILSP